MLSTSVFLPVHSAHIPLYFVFCCPVPYKIQQYNRSSHFDLFLRLLFSFLCLLYFFCFFPFLSFNQYTFSFLFLSVWFMSHPFTTSGKLLPPKILVKTHHASFITIMKLLFFCKGIHSVVAYLILGFGFKCNM